MKNFEPISYISPTEPVSAATFFRPVRADFIAIASTASGSGSEMVGESHTAVNYTETGNSVHDHIVGVDTKLGTLSSQFNSIVANTISVSGNPSNYTKITTSVQGHLQGIDNAIGTKEGTVTAGVAGQYYRGDKTFQTLNATVIPVSGNPTNYTKNTSSVEGHLQGINTAIGTKEASISAGTSAQYFRGDKTMQTLNATVVPVSGTPSNYTPVTTSIQGHLQGINTMFGNGMFSMGICTSVDRDTTAGENTTEDQVINVGFQPRFIKIYYYLQGYNPDIGQMGQKGIAFYSGTTLIGRYQNWGSIGVGSGTNGNYDYPNALVKSQFPFSVDDTTTPIRAGYNSSNNWAIIDLYLGATSATGFTVRKIITSAPTYGIQKVIFHAMYEAYK